MWLPLWKPNRKRRGPTRQRPTLRPQLEALEGRDVPSTLTVTNNLDSGSGSLRAEIAAAKSKDTIVFAPSLVGQTIALTSGELDLTKSLTIQGPGAGQLTVSGNGYSRVFDVAQGVNVTLSGMTISNGLGLSLFYSQPLNGYGGGILNEGTLTVSGCTLSANSAQFGGGVYNAAKGTLTLSSCTVSGNHAPYGGGMDNEGKATVSNSTLSSNSTGGTDVSLAGTAGGSIYNGGTLTVSGCTVSNNDAGIGGGIYNSGGASALTVLDSVFSSNSPGNIYGPYTDGGGNSFQ